MKRANLLTASIAALVAGVVAAVAQLAPPVSTPAVLGNGDLVPCVPGGNPTAAQPFCNMLQIAGYAGTLPAKANVLIGGDATTNLWQRGTAGTAATVTVAYGSADRWASWSGTSTEVKVIRSSTAGDVPAGYLYAFKLQRTSGQTGVVQMCMLQEIESVNVYQLQGVTAELDFHAFTGTNFSAASANMTAYIITGTGADQGVAGSNSVAFGLNAGGGGSGGWTGQANATAAVINLGAVSTAGRYAAIASIPATATEVAVALCYTPVGTAGTNDYIAFSGIQLVRNASLAGNASAILGYSCSPSTGGTGSPGIPCSSFDRSRNITVETALQQRYFLQINEPAASKAIGTGSYLTSTICDVVIPLPVTMRAIPTLVFNGGSATTWAIMVASTTPVVLASTWLIQDAAVGNTVNAIAVQGTTTGKTAGQGCSLVGATGGANIAVSAEL